MCGIAGIVAADRLGPDDSARAVAMSDLISYRGPDGAGLYTDERAALAHRRLSIVDLAGGHQPLSNEAGDVWVTYNGEIYNHADVRPRLEGAGHAYRTRSDTETIVHAYEQWGDDCVHRFRGMFAFGIWDARRRRLLLVRDRLGVKPLYWAHVGNRLLFASEIKAILESGLIAPCPNRAVFSEVLATRGDRLALTRELVIEAGRRGADIIELGIPFSDPLADGPVIQRATQRALAAGVTLPRVLGAQRRVRQHRLRGVDPGEPARLKTLAEEWIREQHQRRARKEDSRRDVAQTLAAHDDRVGGHLEHPDTPVDASIHPRGVHQLIDEFGRSGQQRVLCCGPQARGGSHGAGADT